MLPAADVPTTFPLTEFLVALFEGVLFAAAVIWVKVMLYRQRMRSDRTCQLRRQLERKIARMTSTEKEAAPAANGRRDASESGVEFRGCEQSLIQHSGQQLELALEVPEERHLVHAGLPRDHPGGCLAHPLRCEHASRRFQKANPAIQLAGRAAGHCRQGLAESKPRSGRRYPAHHTGGGSPLSSAKQDQRLPTRFPREAWRSSRHP